MKSRVITIDPVKVTDQGLHSTMMWVIKQVPIQAGVVIPLSLLGDLTTHEKQFFARVSPHEAVICAQVRKALPAVTRHLSKHRPLAVHDLVMTERENEVLRESIKQSKCQIVVM